MHLSGVELLRCLHVTRQRFARAQSMQPAVNAILLHRTEVTDATYFMWYLMQVPSDQIMNFAFGTCSGRRAVRLRSMFDVGSVFSSLGSLLMGACAEYLIFAELLY